MDFSTSFITFSLLKKLQNLMYHACWIKDGNWGSFYSILKFIWFTYCIDLYLLLLHSLTITASSKFENLWILMTHPVDYINLLQGLSDCVFVLGFTWYISCPELQNNHTRFSLLVRLIVPMFCMFVCVFVPVRRGALLWFLGCWCVWCLVCTSPLCWADY